MGKRSDPSPSRHLSRRERATREFEHEDEMRRAHVRAYDERRPGYQEEPWYPSREHQRGFGPSYGYPHFMEDYSTYYYPDYYDRERRLSISRPRRGGIWSTVRSFFGRGPKGYKRSDARIYEDVCDALTRHPDIDAGDIEVEVHDGQVYLRGRVESRLMKRMAEDAVDFYPGVIDVHNELTVREANEFSRAARDDLL